MQTRFSDPILKASAEYHASSTYGPEILRSGCTGWSEGACVHSTVHHQLEIVGLVKSMTVQEAIIRYSWNSSGIAVAEYVTKVIML